ncbi:MAG: 2-oxoacid:acceptor oxidoreductase family protein [Peptococcaceae bacterium]|nr:2-oxoacid:acceptor oxidoreductase family protein [Peptococcaceae bacterium]
MKRFLFAGFGGQGVLFIGKILAQAGMEEGKEVTWLPSYGPEMRGGTANCSVIIAGKKIGSPIVSRPDIAVMMNTVSYQKFLGSVVPGGLLLANASMIPATESRADVRLIRIPVNDMAHELGRDSVANIIMLGAMQALAPVVREDALRSALNGVSKKNPALMEFNERALQRGYQYALALSGEA